MSNPQQAFTDQELRSFLATKRVVVVSEQMGSARSIRKLVIQMGAKADLSFAYDRFEEAQRELESHSTHILISDLFIGSNVGLELIDSQEKKFLNRV